MKKLKKSPCGTSSTVNEYTWILTIHKELCPPPKSKKIISILVLIFVLGCNDQIINPEPHATEADNRTLVTHKTNADPSAAQVTLAIRNFAIQNNASSWTNSAGWQWKTGGAFITYTSYEDIADKVFGVSLNTNTNKFTIDLTANNLSGPLNTSALKSVSSVIEKLILADNYLTSIPATIGDLSQLIVLDLSVNEIRGSIPLEVYNLTNLTHLDLSDNDALSGGIEDRIKKLKKLTHLELDGNNLSGSLPPNFGKLRKLRVLFIEENNLTGTFPDDFDGMTALEWAWLDHNHITGTINKDYCTSFPNLTRLWLDGNALTGKVPMCVTQGKNQSVVLEQIYFEDTGLCIKKRTRKLMNEAGIKFRGPGCGDKGKIYAN
ncbi:MAG: hypothetical protein F4Z63_05130 [Gammaproteobacteria bacterium]|nr:hypothetical protein [Gammaproteobacteria bacterium]